MLAVIGCVLALALRAEEVLAEKWGLVGDSEWTFVPPDEYSDERAIVLFDDGGIMVTYDNVKFSRHVRMKVFSSEGSEDATSIEIVAHKDDEIYNLRAHTLQRDGSESKVSDKMIFRKTAGDFVVTTFAFPNVTNGCVLEYSYKKTNKRFGTLDPWHFQGKYFCCRSTFSLNYARGFNYNYAAIHLPVSLSKPELSSGDARWTITNVPPLLDEPLAGFEEDFRQGLTFTLDSFDRGMLTTSYAQDWITIGEDLTPYFRNYAKRSRRLKLIADSLCEEQSTVLDKLRTLHGFVQSDITTLTPAVGGGLWAFEHGKIDDALKAHSGTATEKNLILTELLNAAGVTANPLLTSTRDHGRVSPEVFQYSQFNYLLCHVDTAGGTMTIDATDPDIPFPYVPSRCLVESGLLLDGDNSAIVDFKIPQRFSKIDIQSSVVLVSDTMAVCTAQVVLTGYFKDWLDDHLMAPITKEHVVELLSPAGQVEFDLIDASAIFDRNGDGAFGNLVLKMARLGTAVEGEWLVPTSPFVVYPNPFDSEKRNCPIDFRFPFSIRIENLIRLRDTSGVAAVPENLVLGNSSAIQMRRSVTNSSFGVLVYRTLDVVSPAFPPSQYENIKSILDMFERCSSDPIICKVPE